MDYRELLRSHVESGAEATLGAVVYPAESSREFGILQVDRDDRILGFEEKPRVPKEIPSQPGCVLANMGIYVFEKETLIDALNRDAADSGSAHDIGRNILPCLVRHRKVHAFRFEDRQTRMPRYWKDVGTIDSYYEASMDWLRQLPASHRLAGSRSVICDGARVHPTAEVVDSVIMPRVVVGPHARVRCAILDENVHVTGGTRIGFGGMDDLTFKRTPKGVIVVPGDTTVPGRIGERMVAGLSHFEPTLEGAPLRG
jgi:glucose-1-phosphate adenylyltransferase